MARMHPCICLFRLYEYTAIIVLLSSIRCLTCQPKKIEWEQKVALEPKAAFTEVGLADTHAYCLTPSFMAYSCSFFSI
jgi:hypothetical protein